MSEVFKQDQSAVVEKEKKLRKGDVEKNVVAKYNWLYMCVKSSTDLPVPILILVHTSVGHCTFDNYRTWKTGTVIDSSLLLNQRSLQDGKFGIQNSFDNKQVRKISHIIKKITVFQHISSDDLITKMDKYCQFWMISTYCLIKI